MAKLRDVPVVLHRVGLWGFAKRLWDQIAEDNLLTWASALAYSWLFAVFPFFIVLLSLLPYLPSVTKEKARDQVYGLLQQLPREAADTIWSNLTDLLDKPRQGLLGIGIAMTFFAASGGMSMTMAAIERCYELKATRPFYRQRPLAIMLTLIVMVLLLSVLILLPVGTIVTRWLEVYGLIPHSLMRGLDLARWSLAMLFMAATVSVIYFFSPNIKQRFNPLSPGALFTIAVWIILGMLFRLYIDRFGGRAYNRTYGTVGGVVILLLFFYVDALVLLVGAEINSEIDFEILGVPRGSNDFRPPQRP